MKPLSAQDEGGQVTPAVFRAALAAILPGLPTAPQIDVQSMRLTAAVASKPVTRRRRP